MRAGTDLLILKLTIVPLALLLFGIIERRHGPRVAGWLSGFPIVGGPLLLFLTLDQGATFGSQAALGALGNLDAMGMSPEQSLSNINRLIDQQAFMLASNDIFGGSALIFMMLIPTIWFAERWRSPVVQAPAAKAPAPATADAAAGAH